MNDDDDNPLYAATMDALVHGMGVVLIKNTEKGFLTEHVPPHKYLEFADALKWVDQERKKEMQ